MTNATYYDWFTTRVEVARQAGVCYYTPDLLDMKAVELGKALPFTKLMDIEQKAIIELVDQEYLAYLFLNNSNQKMHTQLKKDVANNYSNGNQDAYPSDIHKALTLMNEYKPLKLDNPVVAVQGTAFATKGSHKGGKKGGSKSKKYYSDAEWKVLSSEAQTKIINERKKAMDDVDNEKSAASAKSSKSIKSLTKTMKALEKDDWRLKKYVSVLQKCDEDDEDDSSLSSVGGSTHFQEALEILSDSYPKIALALNSKKSMGLDLRNFLLLDNQLTFDLCCSRKFTSL